MSRLVKSIYIQLFGLLILAATPVAQAQQSLTAPPPPSGSIKSEDSRVTFWQDTRIGQDEQHESVVVMFGNVDFYGETEELVVLGGSVHLRKGSKVTESLVVLGGDVQREEGAIVQGETVSMGPSLGQAFKRDEVDEAIDFITKPWVLLSLAPIVLLWRFSVYALIFGLGILLIYLSPRFTKDASRYLRDHKPYAFAWGILTLMAAPFSIALLAVTIIGIPLVPLLVMSYLLAFFGGLIVVALQAGRLLPQLNQPGRDGWALLVGLVMLFILFGIPILGKLAMLVLVCAGAGALMKIALDRTFLKNRQPLKTTDSGPESTPTATSKEIELSAHPSTEGDSL